MCESMNTAKSRNMVQHDIRTSSQEWRTALKLAVEKEQEGKVGNL